MPEFVWGGAETQFRYLVTYAESHRWNMDVIIEHRFKKEDVLLKKTRQKAKYINFYELDAGTGSGKVLQGVIRHILKSVLKKKYTICLINYLEDLVIAPYLRMLGIQVVYSERIDAAAIVESKEYQKCLSFCNCILANSEYGQRALEQLTGRKVGLIRNGKPVVPMLPGKEDRRISRILVPARIAPDKNQMLMLQFLKQYPEFDGKIVFAGVTGHRSYLGKLRQFVRKYRLNDKVEFLGHVEELQEEYQKADLVILPSFSEGTPNVILEAYAYGRPVIVSDIGPVEDIVSDVRLRFGVKSPDEIRACMQYVERMSEKDYQRLLKENRAYVMKNYRIEKMAEGFAKILRIC